MVNLAAVRIWIKSYESAAKFLLLPCPFYVTFFW